MKRWVITLLALLFIMCGCSTVHDITDETEPTQQEPSPTDTNLQYENIYYGEEWSEGYTITEDWGFFCPHVDMDKYDGLVHTTDLAFLLLSKEPIDPEKVNIVFPGNLQYTVYVNTYMASPSLDVLRSYFNTDLYLLYQDYDRTAFDEAQSILGSGRSMSQEEQENLQAIFYEYEKLTTTDYEHALSTGEGITKFYSYGVLIDFDLSKLTEDVTLTYMDVSWPGVSFRQEFGEIRLHSDFPSRIQEYEMSLNGVGAYDLNSNGTFTYPYYGLPVEGLLCSVPVSKDIILTNGYSLNKDDVFQGIRLVIQSPNSSMDFIWDGQSDVVIDKGTVLEVWATIDPKKVYWPVCADCLYYCIEYTCDGSTDVLPIYYQYQRMGNPYLLWAEYFDRVGVREYYEQHYWAGWYDTENLR